MNGTKISPATVVAVLLADGWHQVLRGSFSAGALGFGGEVDPDVLGFCFDEADNGNLHRPAALAGPLASILAVRQDGSATRHPGELGRPATRRWTGPARQAAA
jgi:hypothetical protein